jgi:hypothetical protein
MSRNMLRSQDALHENNNAQHETRSSIHPSITGTRDSKSMTVPMCERP